MTEGSVEKRAILSRENALLLLLFLVAAGVWTAALLYRPKGAARSAAHRSEATLAAPGERALSPAPAEKEEEKEALPPDLLKVVFIDVGQGDAIHIQTPSGKNILIDAGKSGNRWSPFDAGERVVVPYLRKEGVEELDKLIISHAHDDHLGGTIAVLENLKVDEVIETGQPFSSSVYKEMMNLVKTKKIPFRKGRQGEMLDFGENVFAQILAPHEPLIDNDPNNNSVVIKMIYGKVSFLFTGDVEFEGEDRIVETYGKKIRTTVYKAPHHGSSTSSKKLFYECCDPEAVIICVGKRNKFGHPSKKTLKRFQESGAKIYRTDVHGDITVWTNGAEYTVTTEMG